MKKIIRNTLARTLALAAIARMTGHERVPLEAFDHYPTARLANGLSLRYTAAMEAFEVSRLARLAAGDFPVMPEFVSLRGRENRA